LQTENIEVKVDPRAEWPEIFDEAWRMNRDFFYAPNMHGVDWTAMRTKYAQFLPHLATRDDLNRVIQWLCSELGVGHHRVGGGRPNLLNDRFKALSNKVRRNGRARLKSAGRYIYRPCCRNRQLVPPAPYFYNAYLIVTERYPEYGIALSPLCTTWHTPPDFSLQVHLVRTVPKPNHTGHFPQIAVNADGGSNRYLAQQRPFGCRRDIDVRRWYNA
jgi:hypothetical protein